MKLFNFQQDGYFSSRGHSEIPKISFLRQNVFVKIPFLGLLFYSLGYHILNPRNGHFLKNIYFSTKWVFFSQSWSHLAPAVVLV